MELSPFLAGLCCPNVCEERVKKLPQTRSRFNNYSTAFLFSFKKRGKSVAFGALLPVCHLGTPSKEIKCCINLFLRQEEESSGGGANQWMCPLIARAASKLVCHVRSERRQAEKQQLQRKVKEDFCLASWCVVTYTPAHSC